MRHILPNTLAPIIVLVTVGMAAAIIAEAALSFLWLGVQPPTPSWGTMLNEGRAFVRTAPHISTFPGLAMGQLPGRRAAGRARSTVVTKGVSTRSCGSSRGALVFGGSLGHLATFSARFR